MRSLWRKISNVGLTNRLDTLDTRADRLSNQINLVLIAIMTLLNIVTGIDVVVKELSYNLYASRLLILEAVLFFNILMARKGKFRVVKLSLIFLPVLTLIIIPTLLGYVQTSSFFYYHIVVIGLSLAPVALLNPLREWKFYAISVGYFFLIMLFLDNLMIDMSNSEEEVKELIGYFRIYYKIIPLSIFCFVQLALFYLSRMSIEYEKALTNSNEELKLKVDQLEKMQVHLVQNEKMISLGTMVAGVAHEINNPLNFIKGGLDILNNELTKGSKITPSVEKSLDVIGVGIERSSRIVSSMKSFSYKQSMKKEAVSLNDLIDDCLLLLSTKITDDIVIEKQYKLNMTVPAFKEKVLQVVINLVDNAIYETSKMNFGHRLISIITEEHRSGNKSWAKVSIYNTGNQIPESILSQIFDPFFTTKDPGEGTGLGLSISHSNITSHNGNITANNVKDGVEISFELPC
ncbi:sensor histidine kinase [Ekhidna sp.]